MGSINAAESILEEGEERGVVDELRRKRRLGCWKLHILVIKVRL
jgi:hypothetical protein